MSRTRHVRPRRTRSDPQTSAKKPGEGKRWTRRNVWPKLRRKQRDVPLEFVLQFVERESE